ncbi:MAG: 4Fe-4S ferredoxin [Bacteroidales bacterium]|nr:4Fe-4S ferredoxin [Bacteroidales bacterium]MDD2204719.1 4Fe-4S ferredoxin [Bacteroidales bacterium]MDD3152893.1 4Fe-4S ferredoxin [Bacteroidales bacterium]MDD3914053.1 4Fe-4S ferredoxin [Bacteroidales bacterium]MDD4634045.1 4Fe-4S ferredoxin [Bacteroidales bacterium]
MKRKIISIDEQLCNGCGSCVEGCHEGALQLIDGKARIVSELYCDGLGACIGECPTGAIKIEERDVEPYNETAVMERISSKGEKTIVAHLKHLKDHGEKEYFVQGIDYIREHNLNVDISSLTNAESKMACGCPGSIARSFAASTATAVVSEDNVPQSQLTHWPVQLHLLNPEAGYFTGEDVVLAADCTAFAFGDFHNRFLKGKKLAIACPKLDSNKEEYVEKITKMIDSAKINTLTVVIMEVPCCGGLMQIAKMAADKAMRKVPIKQVIIGLQGEVKNETWV